jgi:hypothetical protein
VGRGGGDGGGGEPAALVPTPLELQRAALPTVPAGALHLVAHCCVLLVLPLCAPDLSPPPRKQMPLHSRERWAEVVGRSSPEGGAEQGCGCVGRLCAEPACTW